MKEQDEKKKKKRISKEKRFYLATAIGCALALITIVTVAVVASVNGESGQVNAKPPIDSSSVEDPPTGGENEGDVGGESGEEVGGKTDEMIMPVATVSVLNDYGFYHNQTLNTYHEHTGIDFSAEAGTDVFAVAGGVVESVYTDDILLGTEIVVDHGDGLKTVYRFVTEAEGLKVGDKVEKGEVIATVAEANGNEYKDGAHLHFEVFENGKKSW
jgi:murein DD-endopeptidase MepM/ murein hydrolase activator NlpD